MIWIYFLLGITVLFFSCRSLWTLISCRDNITRGKASYEDFFVYSGVGDENVLRDRYGLPDSSGFYKMPTAENHHKAWLFYWVLWLADTLAIALIVGVFPAMVFFESTLYWAPIAAAIAIRVFEGLAMLVLGISRIGIADNS